MVSKRDFWLEVRFIWCQVLLIGISATCVALYNQLMFPTIIAAIPTTFSFLGYWYANNRMKEIDKGDKNG